MLLNLIDAITTSNAAEQKQLSLFKPGPFYPHINKSAAEDSAQYLVPFRALIMLQCVVSALSFKD